MKLLLFIILFCCLSINGYSQVYSNTLVEVNLCSEMVALNVSAPFVWCRQDNTLYFYNPNLATFTPYPSSTVTSVNSQTGAVTLTKSDIGLSNVDNTSDINKPVSTAQQTALNNKVNTSQPYGYTINVLGLTSSPVDAQTIFFGYNPKAPTTTAVTSQIFIRKAGTIKIAEIYCFSGTAGTNESWSIFIRVNNTTDTLIQTVSDTAKNRIFSNTSLNIPVSVGDYIEIKSVNPTWVTNPLTTTFGGYIYIE